MDAQSAPDVFDDPGDNAVSAGDASPPDEEASSSDREDLRGMRYCEIVLVTMIDGDPKAEVWGTQGLSLCPAASWEGLDADAIAEDQGAALIKLNGPRYFLMNDAQVVSRPEGEVRLFGDLEMRLLASLKLDGGVGPLPPYTTVSVVRTNTWIFNAGEEVYELVAPDGVTYVMQSYAQSVDPTLEESSLASQGARLELPDGWSYASRVLSDDLVVIAEGEAIVIQDELENTYQRR